MTNEKALSILVEKYNAGQGYDEVPVIPGVTKEYFDFNGSYSEANAFFSKKGSLLGLAVWDLPHDPTWLPVSLLPVEEESHSRVCSSHKSCMKNCKYKTDFTGFAWCPMDNQLVSTTFIKH